MRLSSKEWFIRNVKARLKHLKIAAHAVSVERNPKQPQWLTDILRRSDIPLPVGDEIAEALGVTLEALVSPSFQVSRWKAPRWVDDARERVRTAQKRGAATRAKMQAEQQA
jgi:hypothetical protein